MQASGLLSTCLAPLPSPCPSLRSGQAGCFAILTPHFILGRQDASRCGGLLSPPYGMLRDTLHGLTPWCYLISMYPTQSRHDGALLRVSQLSTHAESFEDLRPWLLQVTSLPFAQRHDVVGFGDLRPWLLQRATMN